MAFECDFCAKRTSSGFQITRRGLAKKKGGVGKKVTGRSKRKFRPNLQRIRAVVDGRVRRVKVCAKCLKKGVVTKPLKRLVPVAAVAPASATA